MNHKQMILVEYLTENILNIESDKEYQMVFKMNGLYYSGNTLQINKSDYGYNHFYIPLSRGMGMINEIKIFDYTKDDMDEVLRKNFFTNQEIDSNSIKVLLKNPQLLFIKIVDYVLSINNVDDYFNNNINIPSVIYNLENLYNDQKFDFYIIHDEELYPVSLREVIE